MKCRLRAILAVAATAGMASASMAASIDFGYLGLTRDDRYHEDRVYARNLAQGEGEPEPGLAVALRESRFNAKAVGVELGEKQVRADDAKGLLAGIERLYGEGTRYFLIDAPGPVVAEVAAAVKGRDLLLFNISAHDDVLRQQGCQANLLHTAPSHAMQADALAQYLVFKKWRSVLVLQGPLAEDALIARAFERSAKRFGIKIEARRDFILSNDPRERDQGNVGLLTSDADYDVVFVADSDGEFARSVPYRTVRPRPVVGAEGLVAVGWHWSWERNGAPQLNTRFERQAKYRMSEAGWAAWMAAKTVVEAMQRTGGADFGKIRDYLLGPEITIDGFKGHRLSFRSWNHQLRQPMLLATHNAVIERAPIQGFMHQTNTLDTLGFDQRESQCKF
ncbi:MAG: ABC transporter substrate-binding protein [Zoogloeaceae bacterium]|nr:ABC transporter substrate-binding protein [Rhodocyclaceae bacterium]MCP5238094.1 ABC transporter substrate-binding protein [Zoogloeaceae bacterium]